MSKIQLDVEVANGVAIDVANDVYPICWMDVYPFRYNQSKSLLHMYMPKLNDLLCSGTLGIN